MVRRRLGVLCPRLQILSHSWVRALLMSPRGDERLLVTLAFLTCVHEPAQDPPAPFPSVLPGLLPGLSSVPLCPVAQLQRWLQKSRGEPRGAAGPELEIVGLQSELAELGVLKNKSDSEEFWKLIQEEARGTGVKEKLQGIKLEMVNSRPCAAPRRQETRPHSSASKQGGLRQGKQSLLARLSDWRKRCQEREAAGKISGGLGENKITCQMNKEGSRSEVYLRCLDQMYSTSLANMEFSRRLLERDGRFADTLTECRANCLQDFMIPRGHSRQDKGQPRASVAREDTQAPSHRSTAHPSLCFLKCQMSASVKRDFHPQTRRQHMALPGRQQLPVCMRAKPAARGAGPVLRPPEPLALEHLFHTHPVLEAKTASRYWINYVDEE